MVAAIRAYSKNFVYRTLINRAFSWGGQTCFVNCFRIFVCSVNETEGLPTFWIAVRRVGCAPSGYQCAKKQPDYPMGYDIIDMHPQRNCQEAIKNRIQRTYDPQPRRVRAPDDVLGSVQGRRGARRMVLSAFEIMCEREIGRGKSNYCGQMGKSARMT